MNSLHCISHSTGHIQNIHIFWFSLEMFSHREKYFCGIKRNTERKRNGRGEEMDSHQQYRRVSVPASGMTNFFCYYLAYSKNGFYFQVFYIRYTRILQNTNRRGWKQPFYIYLSTVFHKIGSNLDKVNFMLCMKGWEMFEVAVGNTGNLTALWASVSQAPGFNILQGESKSLF